MESRTDLVLVTSTFTRSMLLRRSDKRFCSDSKLALTRESSSVLWQARRRLRLEKEPASKNRLDRWSYDDLGNRSEKYR
jgi:hypothetical protein